MSEKGLSVKKKDIIDDYFLIMFGTIYYKNNELCFTKQERLQDQNVKLKIRKRNYW